MMHNQLTPITSCDNASYAHPHFTARYNRSWSEAMIDNLAAMLECSDAMCNGRKEVWNRRQPTIPPAAAAAFNGNRPCEAASNERSSLPICRDYVGLMVWIGQNLMCKAEEGGWRHTALLLEDTMQVWRALGVKAGRETERARSIVRQTQRRRLCGKLFCKE